MNEKHEAQVHYLVSFIGGFLGIFPIVNASHFLGSAQTANLIEILLGFLDGNARSVLFHAGGAFFYALAIFLVTFLPKHTKLNIKILAMTVDVAAGFAMWLFPTEKNLPVTVYLYPTFFAMAFLPLRRFFSTATSLFRSRQNFSDLRFFSFI